MIRINLLGTERKQAKKAPAIDLGQRLTVACSLILVASVVGIGWWYCEQMLIRSQEFAYRSRFRRNQWAT